MSDPRLCRCGKPGCRSYFYVGDIKKGPPHWRCERCFNEDFDAACATLGFARPTMKYANVPKKCDGCGSEDIHAWWAWVYLCLSCDSVFNSVLNDGLAECPPCVDALQVGS